tara:strand:- start:181 stop:453 length:273 start_codon:yes stop_codon:yes gene_type:complete
MTLLISHEIQDIIDKKITPYRNRGAWAATRLLKRYDRSYILKMSDKRIDKELRFEIKEIADLSKKEVEKALDYAYFILTTLVVQLYTDDY